MPTVFITGASGGLGAALARHYAHAHFTVGVFARRATKLNELARELERRGARIHSFVGDVTQLGEVSEAVERFARVAGRLDVVIANAGVAEDFSTTRLNPHSAHQILSVNLVGLSNTLLPAAQLMSKQRSGTLVGMSSVAGFRALPGSLSYSAAKAGVLTFMEGLSLELADSGVHAMSICPGFVRTPMTQQNDFFMPFLMDADQAAARMARAIQEKKYRYTFPLPMAILAQVLRYAPHALLHAASPKSPKKRRK